MLDKIICRLIKKRVVTFGDIVDHMKFYAFIYAELIMVISLTPVITAIFNPQSFELVALGTPAMIIFIIVPYLIIYSFKHILETMGVYSNIIEMKIAERPKNYELTENDENAAGNLKEKIMLSLGCIIFLLMIILVVEIIYYDVPTEGLFALQVRF